MSEFKLSCYGSFEEFVGEIAYFDKKASEQLIRVKSVSEEWMSDIIVRFVGGKVEIVVEGEPRQ